MSDWRQEFLQEPYFPVPSVLAGFQCETPTLI